MLRRVIHTDEVFEVVLICDPSVWAAQIRRAREEVAEDMPKIVEGDFVEMFIEALRMSVGDRDLSSALTEVKAAADALLGGFMSSRERDEAEARLRKEMNDADLRECLAWVRAQNSAANYRNTSDPSKLLVERPEDATIVKLRAIRSDEQRRIERAVGPRPRLGAIHYSKAADAGRRAARKGEDSAEVFAQYLQELPPSTLAAVEDFEDWQEQVDRLMCARSIRSISGFDLDLVEDEYPILEFLHQVPDLARDIVSEIAAHTRQVGSLGKSEPLSSASPRGTGEPDGEAADPPKGGHVDNASEAAVDTSSTV